MTHMIYYRHAWPASFDTCPPDDDFGKWLAEADVRDRTIFHFGTGAHHRLGQVAAWLGNRTLGLTASREEMDAYESLVIDNPALARNYQVLFGDIYLLNPMLLPDLDIATVFHLCEFTDPRRNAPDYGGCSDTEVCERLRSRLRPGGWLVAYPGSMAWNRAAPIFEDCVARGYLLAPSHFRSLALYQKAGAA